ncbi:hypothetical protein V1511DRAFT_454360 [Dipodascopsis uninucleata]
MVSKKRKYSRDLHKNKSPTPQEPVLDLAEEARDDDKFSLKKVNGLLVHEARPDYSLFDDTVDIKEADLLNISLRRSRMTWMAGAGFERFWTRPQRGRKLQEGQYNARDKMSKLCECTGQIGPHFFDMRFFTIKDEKSAKELKKVITQNAHSAPSPHTQQHTQESLYKERVGNENNTKDKTASEDDNESVTRETSDVQHFPTSEQASAPTTDIMVTGALGTTNTGDVSTEIRSSTSTSFEAASVDVTSSSKQIESAITSKLSKAAPIAPATPKPRAPSAALIERLHALARSDPNFGLLMRTVASGHATIDEIRRFQLYVNQNRTPVMSSSVTYNRTPTTSKPKPEMKKKEKEIVHDQTIVFEFKDNPNNRFLFPKQSILRFQADGVVKVLFLMLYSEKEATEAAKRQEKSKEKTKKSKRDEKNPTEFKEQGRIDENKIYDYYTPVTFKLYGVPKKAFDIFRRSVLPETEVLKYMQEMTSKIPHSRDWWVYYKVPQNDLETIEKPTDNGLNSLNAKKKTWSTTKDGVCSMQLNSAVYFVLTKYFIG